MIESLQSTILHLKEKKPLILCLTNYVTMDLVANALLALGAAPLMSESIDEMDELVQISDALYINIGTLDTHFMERVLHAAHYANALNKPVILDPVGAGASTLRTSAALKLIPFSSMIRGNASEIMSLSGTHNAPKGVESMHSVANAIDIATKIALDLNKIIIISGPKDCITNGMQSQILPYGSPMMPLITGMGCTLSAVISAFVSLDPNYFNAATQATAYFGLCGQLAHQKTSGPGFFRQVFIDTLFQPDWNQFEYFIGTS